ncbi:MAG: DMT family transporter [Planctomycetes bacterium]|nr:DMT family transporter [Planctomycetota bacterium]
MSDSRPRASRAAYSALLATTVVWGATFLVMKEGIAAFARAAGEGGGETGGGPEFGPTFYLALRFALAFPVGCLVFRISPVALSRSDWKRGGYLAAAMVAGFAFQIYGLERTTAATNAFLTSLYVVFTPILDRIFGGRPAAGRVLAGVALALAGVLVLFRPWTGAPGSGEVLSAACAVLFAAHILLIDRLTRDGRAVELTLTTIGWAAASFLVVVPFLGGSERLLSADFWSAAFSDPWLTAGLPGIVLLATVGALWVSNRYQKELSPARAAVIYTIEPVWALLFSGLAGKESLDRWFIAGAALIVAGNLWSEVGWPAPR